MSVAEGLCFREPAGVKCSSSRQTCPFLPEIPFEWHEDPEFTWHSLLGEKGRIYHVEESGGEFEHSYPTNFQKLHAQVHFYSLKAPEIISIKH